jgi:hypothetical protein
MCLSEVNIWILRIICRCPFFVFSCLKWEIIVRLVDIGGIVDHLCLDFLSKNEHITVVLNVIKLIIIILFALISYSPIYSRSLKNGWKQTTETNNGIFVELFIYGRMLPDE